MSELHLPNRIRHSASTRPSDPAITCGDRTLTWAELDGETGLAQLAAYRLLPGDVAVPDELLRNRRATLDDLAFGDVAPESTGDALVVDPAVAIEAPVLHGDGGPLHPRAYRCEGHRLSIPFRGK